MTRPPIHPGEILAADLIELDLSAASLARALHVSPRRIRRLRKGQRALTADMALRLGQWFGAGPDLWITLQTRYELRVAERLVGQEIRETIVPFRQPMI